MLRLRRPGDWKIFLVAIYFSLETLSSVSRSGGVEAHLRETRWRKKQNQLYTSKNWYQQLFPPLYFLINDQCFNLLSTCIKSDFTKQRLYQQRSEGGTHPETLNIHTKIDGKIFMIVFSASLWTVFTLEARSLTHTHREDLLLWVSGPWWLKADYDNAVRFPRVCEHSALMDRCLGFVWTVLLSAPSFNTARYY